jgi:DNA-binding MarR family transcriptional regulator
VPVEAPRSTSVRRSISSAQPSTVTHMATRKRALTNPPQIQVTAAPPQADGAVRVLRQFRLVFNAVKTHFQQMEKRAGLSGAQVWALSVVRDRPGIGVNDLARAMDVRQPTASNLVKALVEQEMVDVRRHERDGRAVMLHLRPAGAAVLRRAPGPFTGVLPQALAALDAETLGRLEQDLSVLIQVLGADERGASIPLSQM